MRTIIFVVALGGVLMACGCRRESIHGKETGMKISSPAFSEGQSIPQQYTCDGNDVSPPLQWLDAPANTGSFAIIVEDPDAPSGTFTHWVYFNISPTTMSLGGNVPKSGALPDGAAQGKNDFGNIGYGGPCPPPGNPHRYYFKFFALDARINAKPGADLDTVQQAMKGHILSETQLMGKYKREK